MGTPVTTQFFDYTHVTWPRHDAARRHSSPLSARHARTHVAQQALGHRILLRVVCSESRREKRSACDPLGPGTPCTRSVRRPKSDMQHGAPVHPGMCTHTSEHARAFRAQMGRGKLQLQPQRPHGGGRAEKSASPQRKRDLSDPGANNICDTRHATTQIYYRRDRASTTTRVPKDPYHSRKMTTRRCDFRHQPSAGCTYSSSAVLRATSRGVS